MPSAAFAAWIPLSELIDRAADLPPKSQTLRLVKRGDFREAFELLTQMGRTVELVEPIEGSPVRGRLWAPNAFLEDCLPSLRPGRSIELACGGGREAIFLAGSGWEVSAIDVLDDGLQRARIMADRHLDPEDVARIMWIQRDLESEGIPEGTWDLATSFFFLDRDLLRSLPSAVNCGGSVILETFLEEHAAVFGKPKSKDRLLKSGELPGLFPGAEIVRYEEGPFRNRITARGWFRF